MYYTVLIPVPPSAGGDAAGLSELVAETAQVVARLGRPFEAVCLVGSGSGAAQAAERLARQYAFLQVVRVPPDSGLSRTIAAGIASSDGEVIITMEASGQYMPAQMRRLIDRLSRADLVVGRRSSNRLVKLLGAVCRVPRRLLLGLDVRDPDCLFWAARREALAGIDLQPGMHRFLGSLVSSRGFRVTEIHVEHRKTYAAWPGREAWPSARHLLAAWRDRRCHAQAAEAARKALKPKHPAQPLQRRAA